MDPLAGADGRRRPRRLALGVALALGLATALTVPAGSGPRAAAAPVTGAAPGGLRVGDPIPGEILVRMRGEPSERLVEVPEGVSEADAIEVLERSPAVASASRDYVVGVAGTDDPGRIGIPGGWREDQWHLLGTPGGINAPAAWAKLAAEGQRFGRYNPRRRGPIVAVIDTGVAFHRADGGRYRRSPDLAQGVFVEGFDFIDGDRRPLDQFGHGTHMASTIAEGVRNGRAVRGIAPGVRLMPVRVLDRYGFGRTSVVARGVRWAARHGARVINISIEYGSVPDCKAIPALCRSIKYAMENGSIVVAAAGNSGRASVPLPEKTIITGAATLRGCLAAYSNRGQHVDILAPGGGRDAEGSKAGCDPHSDETPGVVQLTVKPRGNTYNHFAYPRIVGTSSAAAHVSGVVALVLASQAIGPRPKPAGIVSHLRETGRTAVGLPANSGSAPLLDAGGAVGAPG